MSNDMYSRRSRKKNRKLNNQQKNPQKNKMAIYAASAFAIIIVVLFIVKFADLGKLSGYSSDSNDYQLDSEGIIINSGKTAEENFPVKLSDSSDYQMGIMERNLVVLSDTELSIYSPSGILIESRKHDYSNVILKCENQRSLIYESGGSKFRVENNKKTIYEKTIEDSIIFARISKDGYIALVSTSPAYSCMLTLYDPKGNEIYRRGSVSRIIEVCFNNESTECRVSIMDANCGRIVSTVYGFAFRKDSNPHVNALKAEAAELQSAISTSYETQPLLTSADTQIYSSFEVSDESSVSEISQDLQTDAVSDSAGSETAAPVQTEDIFTLDGTGGEDEEDVLWRTKPLDTLCMSLNSTFENKLIIIGDNLYGYYGEEGKYIGGYTYKNTLVSASCYDDKLVMIFSNDERRASSVIIVPGSTSAPIEKIYDDKMKAVICEEKYAYVMTEREIIAYDYEGNITAKAPVSNIYKSFLKSGDSIFLIGNSRIDKINFFNN